MPHSRNATSPTTASRWWTTTCPSCGRNCALARRTAERRRAVDAHNAAQPKAQARSRITPVKFGILHQQDRIQPGRRPGAHIYADGQRSSITAATEMGQGCTPRCLRWLRARWAWTWRAASHAHQYRQGAEHLGHRGQQRLGPQRRGGEGCLRDPRWHGWHRWQPNCWRRRVRGGVRRRCGTSGVCPGKDRALRRRGRCGLPRARQPPLPASSHAAHPLGRRQGRGHPFSLLCLGAAVRGGGVRLHWRAHAVPRGHPARRRRFPWSRPSTAARSKAASCRARAGFLARNCAGTPRALLTDAPSTYKILARGRIAARVGLFRRSRPPSTDVIPAARPWASHR